VRERISRNDKYWDVAFWALLVDLESIASMSAGKISDPRLIVISLTCVLCGGASESTKRQLIVDVLGAERQQALMSWLVLFGERNYF
jgi:hypothetical protein